MSPISTLTSPTPSTTPSPSARWLRFNLVGLLGAAVQLATLALLNRIVPHHYLLASAIALEVTLLHNGTWHLTYTWCDRFSAALAPSASSAISPLRSIILFHLSNGTTSLLGNLALMRLLVGTLHLPVLAANALAILLCSLLNFAISNSWVFT